MTRIAVALSALCLALVPSSTALAQRGGANAADSIKYKYPSTPKLEALKAEAAKEIDAKAKTIQEMVDQVFSFGELGMQEVETSKYLTGLLEQNGFKVERGVAGIPTRSSRNGDRASR
jgi:aminobenzoyl-glutamate utilization protein B